MRFLPPIRELFPAGEGTDITPMPRRCRIGSESGPAIALCSDAHAQSINLPAASAVVHLDFPTVPRLAEQRVGRVDRLDSPHAEVSVYYPDDHADFALRADEKFFERHHLVAELLGANIPLPELTRRLEVEKGRVIPVEDVDEEPSVGDESVSAWDDQDGGSYGAGWRAPSGD